MSAKEPGLAAASGYSEDENDQEQEATESQEQKSNRTSSDESDESELELSLGFRVRRKVSFADAFGLDLVSVKEFDSRAGTGSDGLQQLLGKETKDGEEFYLLCIFSVPASDEELHFQVHQNKLILESIELLPGSSTIRGIIRVLNLSYHKTIYVHTTFDNWQSSFDILAEYVPGSSDKETDRFSFQLILKPPFGANGMRLEFCLCYEFSGGTFWANNGGMNYVLFCHQREGRTLKRKSEDKEKETEENDYKGKKSCLKAVRRISTEAKSTIESRDLSEPESLRSEENEEEKAQNKTKSSTIDSQEETCKPLVARRSRRRSTRLAHVQEHFSQRVSESQLGHVLDKKRTKDGLKVVLPPPKHIQAKIHDTSPILPDHQIQLLSSEWGKCTTFSQTHDLKVRSGTRLRVAEQQTKDHSRESSDDAWEAFLKGSESSDGHTNRLDEACLNCIEKSTTVQLSDTKDETSETLSEWNATENTKEFPLLRGTGSPQCIRLDETLDSNPAELLQVFDPNHAREVSGYEHTKETGHSFETDTVQESELARIQRRSEGPCVSKASHDGHTLRVMYFREEESLPLSNPKETTQTLVPMNSLARHEILLEKCATNPDTEEEVNKVLSRISGDPLIFKGITDKPLVDRRKEKEESFEGQHTENSTDIVRMEEHIHGKYDNPTHEYEAMILENKRPDKNKVLNQLTEEDTEMWTGASMACDEGRSSTWTEISEQQAVVTLNEKEGVQVRASELNGTHEINDFVALEEMTIERHYEKVDAQQESCSAAEVICKKNSEAETESYQPQGSFDTYPQARFLMLSMTNQTSKPYGRLSWTESVTEGENLLLPALYKGFDIEKTLRERVSQGPQDHLVGVTSPVESSRQTTSSVAVMLNWLLLCWVKFCSLSHVSGGLRYTVLLVIFVATYLHGLPVCLTIYVLSVCWWCRQNMKKRTSTADSMD